MTNPDEAFAGIRRTLKQLVVATVVLTIVVGGVAFFAWRSASTSHDALCTFRADLNARVASSRDFLKDHPEGFAGIPAATIRASIDQQSRTINALSSLDC